MPLLVAGERRIKGYDPEALRDFTANHEEAVVDSASVHVAESPSVSAPPGNSLDEINDSVADPGSDLASGLFNLLERIEGELAYNDSKGRSAFRAGVHDGLRFARDAVINLITHHRVGAASSLEGDEGEIEEPAAMHS